ncbi:MAG TPA: dihydropteroate synthase, partial [Gammaproteobacteria bacterium]|nr:dihydropteroate synthase [Gammaproteobacteria bacterium]
MSGALAFPQGSLGLDRPRLMGILNVTPDSFSDGGRYLDRDAALAHARALAEAGADILDVGGESTRPGAAEVPVAEELERVVPVVEAVAGQGVPVSVDTRKAAVMRAAVAAGADMINDVSALEHDPEALAAAAELGVPVCL